MLTNAFFIGTSIQEYNKFYWGSRRMPSGLVVGGDQSFVRRHIGISILPMMRSLHNIGVWDKGGSGMGQRGDRADIGC